MKDSTRNKQVFHVFLDTECFYNYNFNFKNDEFTKLLDLIKNKKVLLYTTHITIKEILANIEKLTTDVSSYFSRSNQKNYKILRNFEKYEGLFHPTHLKEEINQTLRERFRSFLEDCGVLIIDVSQVSINLILDKYFSKSPPFSEKKKHEFPDAIVLSALENWASANKEMIYLVSKDGDMVNSCLTSSNLVSINSIVKLLEKITIADGTNESTKFFYECFDTNFTFIEKSIIDYFYKQGYNRSVEKAFLDNLNIKSLQINDRALIDIDEEDKVLVFYVFLSLNGSNFRSEIDINSVLQITENDFSYSYIDYKDDLSLHFKVKLELGYELNQSLITIQHIIFQSYSSESYYDNEGNLISETQLLYDVVDQNSKLNDSVG